MKMESGVDSWFEWTKKQLQEGNNVGLDFSQYPAANLEARVKYFSEHKIELIKSENLVDLVWGEVRPARPTNPVNILEHKYTGSTSLEK